MTDVNDNTTLTPMRDALKARQRANGCWTDTELDGLECCDGCWCAKQAGQSTIEPGDHVHHEPSGEDWVVGRVSDDRLYPLGWPPSAALLSDCKLIRKGAPMHRPIGTLSVDDTRIAIQRARYYMKRGDELRSAVVQAIDAHYGYTFEFSSSPMQHRQEYDDLEAAMLEHPHD